MAEKYTNQYVTLNGERYIVTVDGAGQPIAAAGPLYYKDVTQANLDEGFDSDAEMLDDIIAEWSECRGVSPSGFFRAE